MDRRGDETRPEGGNEIGPEADAGSEEKADAGDVSPEEYVAGIQEHEKVLILVKEELYGGSWARLEADLQARLAGKPYLFKIKTGRVLQRDLEAVRRMRKYEEAKGCDLAKILREKGGLDI
ncbi:MAG: hypothetical protein N3A38_04570 [Planctomycetota bacterium]|nr:hypothetical protein [Planctomycetota bacterium]